MTLGSAGRPEESYVSLVTVPRESRPRLRLSCRPKGTSKVTFTSSIWYRSMTVVPVVSASSEPILHLLEPVAVVDGLEDRRVRPEQGLVLELEVLDQVQDEFLGSRSGDLVVPVRDVLLDGDRRGTSPGRCQGAHDPARRPSRERRPHEPGFRRRRCRSRRRRPWHRSARSEGPRGGCRRRVHRRWRGGSRTGRDGPPLIVVREPAGPGSDAPRTRGRGRRAGRPWSRTHRSGGPSGACSPPRRGGRTGHGRHARRAPSWGP